MIEAVLFVAAPLVVAAFALREFLRRDARMASTLSGTLGLFAVVACALLVLAPIPGGSGPIQYWAGHGPARLVFSYRFLLTAAGVVILLAPALPLLAIVQDRETRRARDGVALLLACAGAVTWCATLTRWAPTA